MCPCSASTGARRRPAEPRRGSIRLAVEAVDALASGVAIRPEVGLEAKRKALLRRVGKGWERRRAQAMVLDTWDGVAVGRSLAEEVACAEELGLLNPKLLDGIEQMVLATLREQVERYLDPVRDEIGVELATRVFGGTDYQERLGRQLGVGVAAAVDLMIEQALMLAEAYASQALADEHLTLSPAWPSVGALTMSFGPEPEGAP